MAATAARRRRHGGHHEAEHENEERWLVSFADMMTLLMCLFMVLFSISSVNVSKFKDLQRSLQEAFSGAVITGGQSALETGASQKEKDRAEAVTPPIAAVMPRDAAAEAASPHDATSEQQDFERLKRRVDAAARELGLARQVDTSVRERGLVVRLRTDGVFFDSGSARLKAGASPILGRLAQVIAAERRHPVVVEGYTDSNPIRTSVYPSNWELSGARASAVVRAFGAGGVDASRMSLAGFAQQHPVASNATAAGRSRNRRVEVVLTRLYSKP